ncbi:MAG: class I SAM-dependent methyltransferase [Micromonosporaceae bacterium]|nr:class I SAM-dependent methyltransferase [Micromonosporaceae bacterium]
MTHFSRHRLFWSIYARIYDQLWDTPHLGVVCDHVDSALPPRAPVLDVGAGTGIVTSRLVRSGRAVVACEPDPAMADRFARRQLDVPLLRTTLAELPAAPGSHAVPGSHVVAVNVLHLLDDPIDGLRRLRELSGPDRLVVVVTPDPTAGLLNVAAAQRRAGVPALRVARFVLWHLLLAPLAVLCGVSSRLRLDWYRDVEAQFRAACRSGICEQFGQPRRIADTYLMLVLPGLGEPA